MFTWEHNLMIRRPELRPGQRIIAVSDIHGNLSYFRGLLEKVGFGGDDALVVVGDFLEKGPDSLGTLRALMALCRGGNVYPLCGNCDCWADVIDNAGPEGYQRLLHYMLYTRYGLFYEMFLREGIPLGEDTDMAAAIALLRPRYAAEWDFLRALPTAVETPHYLFVHGGVRPDIPFDQQRSGECMKLDNFRSHGWRFPKWIIVGHWPVTLYLEDHVCASPIIDRPEKTISIDGGCVLKDDGQLNALLIPSEGSEDFRTVYYDPFPLRTAKTAQAPSARSYYIRWGDNAVEVLSRDGEFSRCRHIRTGYEMDILTRYLATGGDGVTRANDCSDYELAVRPGDALGIIETTSRGYYVKNNGTSGWYHGELE